MPRPTQSPFDRNDWRDSLQRALGIYHWTPVVSDCTVPQQELNFQMSGLDDLNTENPNVRRALRRSYGHWIRQVGVDAFPIDTAFYVPPDFLADFLHARDPAAPGVARVAPHTGGGSSTSSVKASASTSPLTTARPARSTATCAAPPASLCCRAC